MTLAIHTRLATPDDAAALARLNEAFNGVVEPPEELAQRLLNPRRVEQPILAEIAGQPVGLVALRVVPCVFYTSPHAELTELYVEPAYRRQGVGRALVDYAARLAREAGAETLLVLTDFCNDTAQSLYRDRGFVNHDLAMQKDLE
jgi:GNAT superfamily N-acetyltransferase